MTMVVSFVDDAAICISAQNKNELKKIARRI